MTNNLLLIILAVFIFSLPLQFTNAQTETLRLEQLIKNVRLQANSNGGFTQTFLCSDLPESISDVTVSLSSFNSSNVPFYAIFLKTGESFQSNSALTRKSEINYTSSRNTQSDVKFTFTNPVNVLNDLCVNESSVRMQIQTTATGYQMYAYVFGSLTSDAYPGGSFVYNGVSAKDLYFIINGDAEINHVPELEFISDKAVNVGDYIELDVNATDIDQFVDVQYHMDNLPVGSHFENKRFYWTPSLDQEGEHIITLTVNDSGNGMLQSTSSSQEFKITVNGSALELSQVTQPIKVDVLTYSSLYRNNKQVLLCSDFSGNIEKISLSLAGLQNNNSPHRIHLVKTGENPSAPLVLNTRASDISYTGLRDVQTEVEFTFPNPVDVDNNLCSNAETFEMWLFNIGAENYSTTKIFGSNYNSYQGGAYYNVGYGLQSGDMYFVVNPHALTNASPVFVGTLSTNIFENASLTLDASAADPDGDTLTYFAVNLPSGATYDSVTGQFSWTPDYNDAGEYMITLTATDDGEPQLSASTTLTISVLDANRAPVLSPIGNQTVAEGQTLSFTLDATDPDGDTLTYTATNLPIGSTFDPLTRTFIWNTDYDDAGNYENIEFTVSDDGSPMELDFELITITVGDVNRAPVFENPGSQAVLETESLSFSVTATDPDSNNVVVTATNLPSGASWNGSTFTWVPTISDSGVYTITFTATDDGLPSEQAVIDVVITVGDNPTPTEQAEDLIEDVVVLDLPTNVENAYMANLQKVGAFIEEGKVQAALNQLQAFINKITQDYNQGILTNELYTSLLDAAEQLMEDLGA